MARSKLKGLRVPLKQGEWETRLFIRENGLNEMEKWANDQVTSLSELAAGEKRKQESFTPVTAEGREEDQRFCQRSLYFDAVELVDHMMILDRKGLET